MIDAQERILRIAARLQQTYGQPCWSSHGPPIDELVATILSQHTSDTNTERAFRALRERFPTWEDVIAAPLNEIAITIRSAGLSNLKAPRIQEVLRRLLRAEGATLLNHITTQPVSEARERLAALPGVGPKTASCVLLFSLGRPAMPVDTHVHRVSRRLGLVSSRATAEETQDVLERLLGNDRDAIYAFHRNAIAHGRAICSARHPKCTACCLNDLCPTWSEQQPHDS